MFARTISFSSDCDDNFFEEIPTSAAVFLLRGDGEPYVSKTANLRRRLQRLLGRPTELSRRLNLREQVREVEFTLTGSDFETQLLLYNVLHKVFPKTYAARLRLRPAPLVKLHLQNAYPRASVTTQLPALSSSNICYGPFPSRAAAEKFASDPLDFFKMRRCVEDLHPDPAFPGCVYSEMKMCLAPCFKGCTNAEYHSEVERVQTFFETGGESLSRELAEQRDKASAALAFEEAAATHAKIEKLKPLLSQLPEIVRRVDRLDAIIVQPGNSRDSVCMFRFRDFQFAGPVLFTIERHASSEPGPGDNASPARPQTMEARVQQAIGAFAESESASAAARGEQLAILKRWYYRSQRVGEIFFKDDKGFWPLRRVVRGIGRVYRGERDESPAGFSATEANGHSS